MSFILGLVLGPFTLWGILFLTGLGKGKDLESIQMLNICLFLLSYSAGCYVTQTPPHHTKLCLRNQCQRKGQKLLLIRKEQQQTCKQWQWRWTKSQGAPGAEAGVVWRQQFGVRVAALVPAQIALWKLCIAVGSFASSLLIFFFY